MHYAMKMKHMIKTRIDKLLLCALPIPFKHVSSMILPVLHEVLDIDVCQDSSFSNDNNNDIQSLSKSLIEFACVVWDPYHIYS